MVVQLKWRNHVEHHHGWRVVQHQVQVVRAGAWQGVDAAAGQHPGELCADLWKVEKAVRANGCLQLVLAVIWRVAILAVLAATVGTQAAPHQVAV